MFLLLFHAKHALDQAVQNVLIKVYQLTLSPLPAVPTGFMHISLISAM